MLASMVIHCAGDVINALKGVSSDKSIQCDDGSYEENDSHIT